ncbi:unnamed protein product, partial [Brassica oleracea var. botrytis]
LLEKAIASQQQKEKKTCRQRRSCFKTTASEQDWSSFEDRACGPTRITAAIVRVGIGHRVQGPRPAAVRPAKTQLKMVPRRGGTNGLRVIPIAISSTSYPAI